jgi:alkylation response protein AidB-like acyl-CoA dehydrogenase
VVTHMRYHPSAEQLALASTIDESLLEMLPLSRLHASHYEDTGVWASLAEIGIFTMGVSEALGGSGLGAVEESLVVMRLGSRLASPGILATIGAAQISASEQAPATGSQRVAAAYRHGDRVIMVEEPGAALVLLREPCGAALHELPAGSEAKAVDDRLWLAVLREVPGLGRPVARLDEFQLARLRLMDAAALAGIAQATLDMAVAYAGTRQQFGRPIGSFQAVKHHCADMAIAARCARDQVNFAAVALDDGRADALLQVECALLMSGATALANAGKNIQIHGGMGFSDEADPHLFLKRAQLLIAIAGGLEEAARRVATIPGGGVICKWPS